EEFLEFPTHLQRVDPVVGWTCVVLGKRADEGSILDPGDVAGIRAGVVTTWPEILVQLDKRPTFNHLGAEDVVFFFRAVHPMNAVRRSEFGHLFHPAEKMLVSTQGPGNVAGRLGSYRRHALLLSREHWFFAIRVGYFLPKT